MYFKLCVLKYIYCILDHKFNFWDGIIRKVTRLYILKLKLQNKNETLTINHRTTPPLATNTATITTVHLPSKCFNKNTLIATQLIIYFHKGKISIYNYMGCRFKTWVAEQPKRGLELKRKRKTMTPFTHKSNVEIVGPETPKVN